jgi:hypothetical protein
MRIAHEKAIRNLLGGIIGNVGKSDCITKDNAGNMRWLYHGNPIITIGFTGDILINWHG